MKKIKTYLDYLLDISVTVHFFNMLADIFMFPSRAKKIQKEESDGFDQFHLMDSEYDDELKDNIPSNRWACFEPLWPFYQPREIGTKKPPPDKE